MNNKRAEKTIAAFLLTLMLTGALVSCGGEPAASDNSSEVSQQTVTDNAVSETVETTAAEITPDLPEYDGKGADYMVLAKMENNGTGRWTTCDVYVEEQNGEPMNDAVYERNALIKEKYNVTIKQELQNMESIYGNLSKVINAGDNIYDLVMPNCEAAAKLALDEMLYDLGEIGNIDLSKPWWSAQFTEDTLINGANYFINGDVCESFMRATYATFFNKAMINDFSLENPYDLVNSGKWSLDKLYEMAKPTSADLDGDGVRTSADRFGLVMINNQIPALYNSSGEKLIETSSDGFKFIGDSERSLSVLEKIYNVFTDYDTVFCVTDKTRRTSDQMSLDQVVLGETMFANSHNLFLIGTMNNVTAMRTAENDFGILPLPKYDEAQDEYYSYVNFKAASCAAVPITVTDTDKSTIILEEMAYYSNKLYTPAYYDVTLKTKSSRDEESLEMLDLIYERRTADIGVLYKVGNIMSGVQDLIYLKKQNTFASYMASNESAINTMLEQMNSFIK